uniref:Reverse transcriptase domain-containing protein n=1 Tax=Fagus sylvatica TaxID=28930 RepID=A0A2N9G6M3_FAGSY
MDLSFQWKPRPSTALDSPSTPESHGISCHGKNDSTVVYLAGITAPALLLLQTLIAVVALELFRKGTTDETGTWQQDEDMIETTLVSYYKTLFTSSTPVDMEEVLNGVTRVVSTEMNDQLIREFTASEVEHALFQMGPLKAPGPDGRLISDNILIAFETLHHMHQMRQGQQGYMALKLDMSKAYDRVEWVFLEKIMLTMGFHRKWVALMMECVRSVSYSVLINGESKGYFHPSRGLRQGDPISPYLFLLCAEGLHALLSRAAITRQLQGLSISRGGPKLTHLFFADDSVLFCRATLMECNIILEILRKYERASGQQINQEKTTLFFSASTTAMTQEDIQECSSAPSWKEKLLTQAGKEVLIKAMIQAILTYTMHCFKLPKKLCSDLEGIIRNFWWGHKGATKKVFKAKFFPHGTIMDARHSTRASYAWKSILNARHVITKGTRWRTGNGLSTRIWSDKWLPPPASGKPLTPPSVLPHDACVSSLILDTTGVWKQFWKRVWFIQVPHKVRKFIWRACSDSLPTMLNMKRRSIVPTANCSFCHLEDEDVKHALWSCPGLSPVWAPHALAYKLVRRRHSSFLDIMSDLFVLGTTESISELVFMFWLLWNRRNQMLYRNEVGYLDSIPSLALHLSLEYLNAHDSPATSAPIQLQIKWKPSSISAFNVNSDAALFNDQLKTGVGVIIRDGQGLPIAALCKRFLSLHSVDDAEALAVREALQFAMEIGISRC